MLQSSSAREEISMTTNYPAKGTAVITGASGGIGSRYAEHLARRGYDLILVARDIGRINTLCDRLASEFSVCAEGIAADLGEPEGLQRVEERLRADERVTMLVNNAGTGATTTLVDSRQAQIDQMIALNVAALTRLTYSVVPGFIERGTGTLINIASVVGLVPELLNGVYGATKAYVLAFSRSLQHELASKGVRVQVVLPGAIATKFWADSGLPVEQLPSEVVMSADDLVAAALAGFDLGEFATIPSLPNVADWNAYERALDALRPNLSRTLPAMRYRVPTIDA
jgi:short-subunit dehydrogenase